MITAGVATGEGGWEGGGREGEKGEVIEDGWREVRNRGKEREDGGSE